MIVKTLPKVRCELYHKRLLLQVTMGKGAKIKLEDKDSDVLFKEVPIETYPGLAIQSVTDSSRWSRVTPHVGCVMIGSFLQIFCHKSNRRGEKCFSWARL